MEKQKPNVRWVKAHNALSNQELADLMTARTLIKACERDLGRRLLLGERRDLLSDNCLEWRGEYIYTLVAWLYERVEGTYADCLNRLYHAAFHHANNICYTENIDDPYVLDTIKRVYDASDYLYELLTGETPLNWRIINV